MKRIPIMIWFAAFAVLPLSAQKTKQIHILHTNDTHSCIMQLNLTLPTRLLLAEVDIFAAW